MELFVKRFSDYKTIRKATVLSRNMVLDSLDAESSSVTLNGTAIDRSNVGDWAILEGRIYLISAVNPDVGRTVLTLSAPLEAFSRPVEVPAGAFPTVGAFVRSCLEQFWIREADPVYAAPYLEVLDGDTVPYVAPGLDGNGCFDLAAYCRLMRRSFRTGVSFADGGDRLLCTIRTEPVVSRQVSFSDGRSRLQRVDYSASGIAKLTAYQEGEKTDWYLSELGEVSKEIPARRASGRWSSITVSAGENVRTKVIEAFAAGKADHRIEFCSTLDLNVQDDCTFNVYGVLLHSVISSKRKSSTDSRFYYKSGQLLTTAAEKLRGVIK